MLDCSIQLRKARFVSPQGLGTVIFEVTMKLDQAKCNISDSQSTRATHDGNYTYIASGKLMG